jgi:hypothetical protein
MYAKSFEMKDGGYNKIAIVRSCQKCAKDICDLKAQIVNLANFSSPMCLI